MPRNRSVAIPQVPLETETAVVHKPLPHDSARLHVSGAATYIDDIREPAGTLHIAIGMADKAAGTLRGLDLSAVRAAPGVVAVLTAADIPGKNDIAPAFADEPCSRRGRSCSTASRCSRWSRGAATPRAAPRGSPGSTSPRPDPPSPSRTRWTTGARVLPDYEFGRGDAEAALGRAPRRLDGALRIGGQEHFYLEGQAALRHSRRGARDERAFLDPGSDRGPAYRRPHSRRCPMPSSPSRRGAWAAASAARRRQACAWAAIAALAARVTGQALQDPARPRRRFRADRQAPRFPRRLARSATTTAGVVTAYDVMLNARCGCSADLSPGVVDRAMFHAANAYWLPEVKVASRRLKTNTVSNTAFRGFGGPQGMLAIERVMDAIAHERGLDPLDVRKANFYRPGADRTPYGQQVEDLATLPALIEQLEESSDYRARRRAIAAFNAGNAILKKGIALTPVKFGISFTLIHLNQAGALVHVYTDGSIHLNHGGTEMGQGLFTKVAQVVAEEFGVPIDFVRITATNTAKVPNASPTAASSGSDINGMAAQIGAREIKRRMIEFASAQWEVEPEDIVFRDGLVLIGNRVDHLRRTRQEPAGSTASSFRRPASTRRRRSPGTAPPRRASRFSISPSARPAREVVIDTLDRRDAGRARRHPPRRRLLAQSGARHRPGRRRLRPGHGLADHRGTRVRRQGPARDPRAGDLQDPGRLRHSRRFRHAGCICGPISTDTIYRSKAVGEPPLMLPISVYCAILDAVHAIRPGSQPRLEAPCTPECDPECDRIDRMTAARRADPFRAAFAAPTCVSLNGSSRRSRPRAPAALVSLVAAEGSSPRESGARMVVRPSGGFHGTIGGGALEWRGARRRARGARRRPRRAAAPHRLARPRPRPVLRRPRPMADRDLRRPRRRRRSPRSPRPSGRALRRRGAPRAGRALRAPHSAARPGPGRRSRRCPAGALHERFADPRTTLLLFGAGHVGRALVLALAPLPFATRWIDSRRDAFPERAPANAVMVHATRSARANSPPRPTAPKSSS